MITFYLQANALDNWAKGLKDTGIINVILERVQPKLHIIDPLCTFCGCMCVYALLLR